MQKCWFFLTRALCEASGDAILDLVKYTYGGMIPEGMLYQIIAPLAGADSPQQALLLQRYAFAAYKREKQWDQLTVAALDALTMPGAYFEALESLFCASFFAPDPIKQAEEVGRLACQAHARGFISQPQLLALFFNAIAAPYTARDRGAEVSALRRVLYAYDVTLSGLLYTYLQAQLYAHITDSAQELIGQSDPLTAS